MNNAARRAILFGGLLVFSILGILIFSGKASWCNSGAAVEQEISDPNTSSFCSDVTSAHTACIFGAIIFGALLLIFGLMAFNASGSKS